MADSPEQGAAGTVVLNVYSAGKRIPDEYEIVAVRTRAETNRIPEALIVLMDGDVASGSFPATDDKVFKPGAEIRIGCGYGDQPEQTVFSGVVTGVRVRLQQGQLRLEVMCRDKAFRLTLGRRSRVFSEMTDSDVIRTILSDAGLEMDIEATSETYPTLVQARATDWEFLLARAEAAGLDVSLAGGKLTAKRASDAQRPALTATLGEDIIDCDLSLSARDQHDAFTATAWDPKTADVVTTTERAGSSNAIGDISAQDLASAAGDPVHLTNTSAALASSALGVVAKARRDRAERARLRGGVTYRGNAMAGPGSVLELKGLAKRFGGKAVVASIAHRIENGEWLTEAGLGMSADWRADAAGGLGAPPAAALTPALRGLQVATVVKLSEDKQGLFRIKLKLPTVAGDDGFYARYGAPYASSEAGLMLLPEIGDEVVVGFFDDDPAQPVVLGSLHNGKRERPASVNDDDNDVKLFRSRADLRLTFDEKAKSISLTTPGGASVVISDEEKSIELTDHAGNRVSMDSGGVTVESRSDITLKASAGVTISAGTDVKISGVNVEASGQIGATLKGGANAEVSASGQTKVAGAIVMIN